MSMGAIAASDRGVGVATTMIGVGSGSDVGSGSWLQPTTKIVNSSNEYLIKLARTLMLKTELQLFVGGRVR
jgi:hypothetical protein